MRNKSKINANELKTWEIVKNNKVLDLEKNIRKHIQNEEVKIKIDWNEFTLNKIDDLLLPIKVLYKGKVCKDCNAISCSFCTYSDTEGKWSTNKMTFC